MGFNPVATDAALNFYFRRNGAANFSNNELWKYYYANENRISELPGMRSYNMPYRQQDKLRTAVNWQADEHWNLQGGLNYQAANYNNSAYGLKESTAWSLNLDANYQASDKFSVNAFYTFEDQHTISAGNTYTENTNATNVGGFTAISGACFADIATRNLNNKIDPCNDWSANLHDKIDTLGVAFSRKGMLSGKLRLSGDLSVTRARSDTSFTGGNYANNLLAVAGAPVGTMAAYYISATPLPAITTRTIDLRLMADYALDKKSTLRLDYLYSRLYSTSWSFDGMQAGDLTQLLPSYEQNPDYSAHVIGISAIFRF